MYSTSSQAIPCIVSLVTRYGVDYLRQVVQKIKRTEGLSKLATRTGVSYGKLRSLCDGRVPLSTTLESIAFALKLEFYIGPAREESSSRYVLPPEIARALGLPRDAGVEDAVGAIRRDAIASRLREAISFAYESMDRADAAAALIPGPVSHRKTRLRERPGDAMVTIPFASGVRLAARTREVVFEETPEMSIAVAADAVASWARADRLTCIRAVGNAMEPIIYDGDLVAVDAGRTDPVNGEIFAVRTEADLVFRRLRQQGGRWLLTSDKPTHPPYDLTADDRLLGQVAWYGPRNRHRY